MPRSSSDKQDSSPAPAVVASPAKLSPSFSVRDICIGCGLSFLFFSIFLAAIPRLLGDSFLAPEMTPSTIPPGPIFSTIIQAVSGLDVLGRAVTPPNLFIFRQIMSYVHTVELYTAAELSIADHLNGGALSSLSLARLVAPGCAAEGTSPAASCAEVSLRITRLLRSTAAYGVFREGPMPESFSNSPASEFLRAAHPNSVRAVALNFGGVQYRMMAYLPETVRTGAASFGGANNGAEFWSWYKANPSSHAIFDETMLQLGKIGGADKAISTDYAWGAAVPGSSPPLPALETIVDVGGGYGDLLKKILEDNTRISKGIVFDMAPVIERASEAHRTKASASSASPRVSFVAGDMFNSSTIPSAKRDVAAAIAAGEGGVCEHSIRGGVGYSLRDIVHDWADEDVVSIAASIRKVMRGKKTRCHAAGDAVGVEKDSPVPFQDRLLLVDRIIWPGVSFVESFGTNDADIVMLGAFGTTAGERTYGHFDRLLKEAGLKLLRAVPTRSHYYILEAIVDE